MNDCAAECCYRIAEGQTLAHNALSTRGKQDRREDVDIKKALTGHTY